MEFALRGEVCSLWLKTMLTRRNTGWVQPRLSGPRQPPFLLHSQLAWQRVQSVIQQILLEHLLHARQF